MVVTPHLGASTHEAQDKAGVTIAEMVGLAMAGDFVPYAVNVAAAEASETIKPFLPLAERMGAMFTAMSEGIPEVLEITYAGEIADYDTRILTLSVLKGAFGKVSEEPVSYVNAPMLAKERGIEVRDTSSSTSHDFVNLVTISGGHHAISGSVVGARQEPSIVKIDDHSVDVPPAEHMLIVRNDDRPGHDRRRGPGPGRRRREHRRHAPRAVHDQRACLADGAGHLTRRCPARWPTGCAPPTASRPSTCWGNREHTR